MKKIVFPMLLATIGLIAAESNIPYKSGLLLPPQADKIYMKECAICHGKNGKQTTFTGLANVKYAQIAGMNVEELAKTLKEYRGGIKSKDYGPLNKYGYGAVMKSATVDLSWDELDALATYINGLK